MSVTFARVAPVLPVRDVARALARYRTLGFETRAYVEAGFSSEESPAYGYLRWDTVEIHVSGFSALDPKTTTSVCYLFVNDADALYAAWTAAGVEGRFRPPIDTTYGKREFGYVDPDGNLLRVGSPLGARSVDGG
jgi:catechol 2,3-dioxygenase-like lactoylglutathione lyase family enzyme